MMYFTCSKLTYAGSSVITESPISTTNFLRIKVKIDLSSCKPASKGWQKPSGIDFSSIFLVGRGRVLLTVPEIGNRDLGTIDIPSNAGWLNGFFVDVPLSPEIRDIILGNREDGSLRMWFEEPGVILGRPETDMLFASLIFYIPKMTNVVHPKATNEEDLNIALEKRTLEEISKIDLAHESAGKEAAEVLKVSRRALEEGKTEKAATSLRAFIMNDLTRIDKSKPESQQRLIKDTILDAKLSNYDNAAKSNLELLINKYIQKILDLNLEILHKYVKDDKIIQIPDYDTVLYVYKNISNLVRFLNLGEG